MSNRKRIWQTIVGFLIIVAYGMEIYFFFTINKNPSEDAFITFRFARNLAEGNGPVFNTGEPVEGYSNFLWMSLIAGAHKLGLDMISFSRFAGALCNTLTLFLTWYIPYRYFAIGGSCVLLGPLLYILFVPFHYTATIGLETSAFTFLIILSTCLVIGAHGRPPRFALASFVFLLLALTRPEGNLYFAFYAFYLIVRWVLYKDSIKPYIPGFIIFIAGYCLFMFWRFSYYQLLFPNTYYAKVSFPLFMRAAVGFVSLKGFFLHYPYLILFFLMFWRARMLCIKWHIMAPVVIFTGVGLIFNLFAGFEWMPFFRYVSPIVPLMIILCQTVFASLWQTMADASNTQRLVWRGITLFCLVIAAEQFICDLAFNMRLKDFDAFAYNNQKFFGEWFKKEIGTESMVCIGDVGRIAYFSEAKIMDIVGLTSREFAMLRQKYGSPDLSLIPCTWSFNSYKNKERELLLKLKPDYVLLYNFRFRASDTFPGSNIGIAEYDDFKSSYEHLGSFSVIPKSTSLSWPKPYYYFEVVDLSSGLLAWINEGWGWGYEIYVRKDYPGKRFKIELFPDDRIKAITVTNSTIK